MKLTDNQKLVLKIMLHREKRDLAALTAAEIGEEMAPDTVKNRKAWGRDNVRRMAEAGLVKELGADANDTPTWEPTLAGRSAMAEPAAPGKVDEVWVDEAPVNPQLEAYQQSTLDAIMAEPNEPVKTKPKGSFFKRMFGFLTKETAVKQFGAEHAKVVKRLAKRANLSIPEMVRAERASHLAAFRAMPKGLRTIGKKGTTNRRVLVEFKSEIDGRTHRYHATRGWRSLRT